MKRFLFLLALLFSMAIYVKAWDEGYNNNLGWRGVVWKAWTTNPPYNGPSKLLWVTDNGGGRHIGGHLDLIELTYHHSIYMKENIPPYTVYAIFGQPFTELGGGLFKDLPITGFTGFDPDYNIPGTWDGVKWQKTPFQIQIIGAECFRNSGIQGNVIDYTPRTVHTVGPYAFADCTHLTGNLVTPQNVTIIQEGTYQNCTGMTGILRIHDGVTKIEKQAFYGCRNLSSFYFPSSLQSIGDNAFNGCSNLSGTVIIPNSVIGVGKGAFAGCKKINGVRISDNMQYVPECGFQTCIGLIGGLTIPSNIIAIGHYAFQDCWNLSSLYIEGNLWAIGDHAFENCHGMHGNLDIHTVNDLGSYAFLNCYSLDGVLKLSGGLSIIPDGAFKECRNLRGNLVIPSSNTIGREAFYNCASFDGTLTLPPHLQTIKQRAFFECRKLRGNLVLPNELKRIEQDAFMNCERLEGDVIIPASVDHIGLHSFWYCAGLNSITFAAGSNLTDISTDVWNLCHRLKYIDMSACPPLTASTVNRAANGVNPFGGLYPYTIIYLPNGTDKNKIPVNQENFVVDGECKNFMVYDSHIGYNSNRGCDYPIQHQFTAAKANYTRTFSGTDAMTLFLPYPTMLPAGMTAYELKNMKRAGGEAYFVFSPLPSSATLEANKAYVVRVTDGGSHNLPEMHNVVVPVTPALASTAVLGTADNNWQFNGTTQFIPNVLAASMKAYNLNAGNTWLPVTTANTNGHIHSFRGFLTSPTGMAPAKSFVMVMDEGPTVTDIDSVRKGEADVRSGRYPFYSLDGKNLGRDYNRLPSGNIYIVNGKKFYKN